ncbi:MAG: hypothetical protein Q8P12_05830, partial [bacterium]|nr:hypothetical protein [bacterium]
MDYKKTVPEEWETLKNYDLRTLGGKDRTSLRSAVMFLERYYDLLRPGGRLLTVIDDSVLGGKKMGFVRDFIRERFIINGIVSFQGDAFQRAGARTKTSVVCLTKRTEEDKEQPAVFVYESRYIGLDDVPARTPPSVAEEARNKAIKEIDDIVASYEKYHAGEEGPWLVQPGRLSDRLDAKYLIPWSVEKLKRTWARAGAATDTLENLVDPIEEQVENKPKTTYTFLRISYEGFAESGERRLGKEVSYAWVGRARPEDIVVSNISAVYRAICVFPEGMDDVLITPEFTVLRIKQMKRDEVDPMYLWSVLRSPAVIAEWLSQATGVGRHRVVWDLLKNQKVPLLPPPKQREIGEMNRKAYRLAHESTIVMERATAELDALDLYGEAAKDKLVRAKPPR